MKVLLQQHVKNLGTKGDIVEVPDGYAQNSLIPQKKAIAATKKVLNAIEQEKRSKKLQAAKQRENNNALLALIEGKGVSFKVKLNEKDQLYHAISKKEIIKEFKATHGITLPKNFFREDIALKDTGTFPIELAPPSNKGKAKIYIQIEGK
ncbi:50S ribosomal protein L9 [Candidatus Campbellbacteria bacterium]|nr:50S ribosomal protein L9 [Candidatus Campbellbacteria bacterium]|tara:strand:- start:868 stop:1317 length:450 start_codon:yes stop_codon:yes gene_type:complete